MFERCSNSDAEAVDIAVLSYRKCCEALKLTENLFGFIEGKLAGSSVGAIHRGERNRPGFFAFDEHDGAESRDGEQRGRERSARAKDKDAILKQRRLELRSQAKAIAKNQQAAYCAIGGRIRFIRICDAADHPRTSSGVVGWIDEDKAAGGPILAVNVGEERAAGFDNDLADVVERELIGGAFVELFDIDARTDFEDLRAH